MAARRLVVLTLLAMHPPEPRTQAHLLGGLLFGLMAALLGLVVAGAMLFAGTL
jgi:hypothetical protein